MAVLWWCYEKHFFYMFTLFAFLGVQLFTPVHTCRGVVVVYRIFTALCGGVCVRAFLLLVVRGVLIRLV